MPLFGRKHAAPAGTLSPVRLDATAKNGLRRSRALVAAGAKIEPRRDGQTLMRLRQPWQARAFSYYNLLGEIKYAAQFYSRMLAPLRLFIAEVDDKGELKESNDEQALAQLARIQDPGGGRSGLLSAYGRLMFLTGEAYLFVSQNPETEREQWEMLSVSELAATDTGFQRLRAPAMTREEYREPTDEELEWEPLAEGALAFRLWRKHPEYSALADATMQGVLDSCEELLLLTQAVRARTRSRLAGPGLLAIADTFSAVRPKDAEADESDPQEDPFLMDLTEAMTAPIVDEGSAASVVPLVVRGPLAAIKDGIKHIQINDPTQLYPESGLRRECVERIALGLDMPAEALLGLADVNHWTGWMVDIQTWKGHGQPIAQAFCDDLTAAFLTPTLKKAGVANWERLVIAFDAAAVINHPDKSKDGKDLHDRGVIGAKALRDAGGFTDADKPTAAEEARFIGLKTGDAGLALTGELTVASEPVVVPPPAPPPPSGGSSPDVVKAPPPEPPAEAETASGGLGNGAGHRRQVADRIVGAADLCVHRVRQVAGNRVRNLAKRDPDVEEELRDVPPGDVLFVLGQDRTRQLARGVTERELVAAASPLILPAFRTWGLDPKAAEKIAERIEQHAARSLYAPVPPPLPPQFQSYVLGLIAVPVIQPEPV